MRHTVLHVSDSVEFGGAERVILQLLEGMDSRRWNCMLLHSARNDANPLISGARSLGVADHLVDVPLTHGGARRLPDLVRQLRALRPTVVHAHLTMPLACTSVLVAASLARVPAVVATMHLYLDLPRIRSRARHRLLSMAVDRYIAVSEGVARKLRHRLWIPAGKVRVVRNAVSLDDYSRPPAHGLRQELTRGKDVKVALVIARLAHHKGHRYLLDAAARLPNVVFVLAGQGPECEALRQQSRELGISDRVRFLGYRTDVPELLASSDLLVLPSLNEGLPLSVLEAMAAGKPVLSTCIGGTNEAVVHRETGLLVPPGDTGALTAALRELVQDDALARRLGAGGRARASAHFRVEAMVRQVAGVYDELLA